MILKYLTRWFLLTFFKNRFIHMVKVLNWLIWWRYHICIIENCLRRSFVLTITFIFKIVRWCCNASFLRFVVYINSHFSQIKFFLLSYNWLFSYCQNLVWYTMFSIFGGGLQWSKVCCWYWFYSKSKNKDAYTYRSELKRHRRVSSFTIFILKRCKI